MEGGFGFEFWMFTVNGEANSRTWTKLRKQWEKGGCGRMGEMWVLMCSRQILSRMPVGERIIDRFGRRIFECLFGLNDGFKCWSCLLVVVRG